MTDPIRLGPFVLSQPIGSGGMGEIWSAVHEATGVPAALKCIRPARLRGRSAIERFRREVRAVAGLRHRSIVEVYDYGVVDAEAELRSRGALQAGGPYLAMEYAPYGDASRLVQHLDWQGLRALLLQVLSALAHAHSRRVVHLDVKPRNLLLCREPGRIKLADFGIARIAPGEDVHVDSKVSGTPYYMAPEQLHGDWRDVGPWTDLYSVGRLAYRLALDAQPMAFVGDLTTCDAPQAPGDSAPSGGIAVPSGFEAWMDALLRADPAQRTSHAVDAAKALAALPAPGGTSARLRVGGSAPASSTTWCDGESSADPGVSTEPEPMELVLDEPTVETGHTPVAAQPGPSLAGVGLGLYGLRAVPLVDREDEREQLWQRMRAVEEGGRTEVVLLRGPSGLGKTRLAEWLCHRAEELGVADALTATHSLIGARDDGLQGMLERLLRVGGLDAASARQRLERWLQARGATATDGLGGLFVEPGATGLGTRARHAAILRLLTVAAAHRTQILFLDDVQWGADSLDFVEHLLAAKVDARILVVMTVREEDLVEPAATAVRRLVEVHGALGLEVGPLPARYQPALVRGLLGLHGELAERLEQRIDGNAMFAVQLVGDWVDRGWLVPADGGFRLRPGADPTLPPDLQGVWSQRLERLLQGRSEADELALELAAALGQDVSQPEWEAVCSLAGVDLSPDLLGTLLDSRLARHAEGVDRWSFVHGMLRESLLFRAQEGGRLEGLHRTCARYLAKQPGLEALARRAAQCLAASDDATAVELLSELLRRDGGHLGWTAERLGELDSAIERLGLPEGDVRPITAQRIRVRLLMLRGEIEESQALALHALESARHHGHLDELWRLLVLLGRLALHQGNFDDALARWTELDAGVSGNPKAARFHMLALHGQAHIAAFRGDPRRTVELCNQAIVKAEAIGELAGGLHILRGRAWLEVGELDSALATARRVAESVDPSVQPHLATRAETLLGDVLRQCKDPVGAEGCFRRALALGRVFEPTVVPTHLLNIGAALQDQGRYAEGGELLGLAIEQFRAEERAHLEAVALVAMLSSTAAGGDWDTWDTQAQCAEALIEQTGTVLAEVALGWESAMTLLVDAGQHPRSERARSGALRIWRALGRDAEIARLER